MLGQHGDSGFEAFRRERQRVRAKTGGGNAPAHYSSEALRELEAVEAREEREQQLTREVHDFFAAATRQAAGIVERVSREAEQEVGQRLEREVESFLIDALARMNSFVLSVLQQRRGAVAEQRIEARVQNLVGPPLDEFRWAGTAELDDRHIGQDPFATELTAVRGELQPDGALAPAAADPAGAPAPGNPAEVAAAAVPSAPGALAATPAAVPAAAATVPATTADGGALEQFKAVLRDLVLKGTMTRDEARAAWQARLRTVGCPPGASAAS